MKVDFSDLYVTEREHLENMGVQKSSTRFISWFLLIKAETDKIYSNLPILRSHHKLILSMAAEQQSVTRGQCNNEVDLEETNWEGVNRKHLAQDTIQ
jgi:hypothetical protein